MRVTRKLLRIIFYLHPHLTLESQEAQDTAYFYIDINIPAVKISLQKGKVFHHRFFTGALKLYLIGFNSGFPDLINYRLHMIYVCEISRSEISVGNKEIRIKIAIKHLLFESA